MYKITKLLTQLFLALTLVCCISLGINNVNVTKDISKYTINMSNNLTTLNSSIKLNKETKTIQTECDTLNTSAEDLIKVVNRSVSNTYILFKLALVFAILTTICKGIEVAQTMNKN